MKIHTILTKWTNIDRNLLYSMSLDFENFSKLMPGNFKNLEIIKKTRGGIFLNEKISFLGFRFNVKTYHVKIPPNMHEVHFISGPLKGTNFIESYEKMSCQTRVSISVTINLNKFWIILYPFKKIIFKKMSDTFDNFLYRSQVSLDGKNS